MPYSHSESAATFSALPEKKPRRVTVSMLDLLFPVAAIIASVNFLYDACASDTVASVPLDVPVVAP